MQTFAAILSVVVLAVSVTAQTLSISAIQDLGSRIDGDIFLPGEEGFEEAAHVKSQWFTNTPLVVVMVENNGDVQETVLFANDNDLQITVESTGHDYLGRSAGSGTVHINLGRMRRFEISRDDPESDTGVSVRLGTGIPFLEIHTLLSTEGLTVQSGNCPGVGAGGYLQGGGLGAQNRFSGFGVDNILEITMVALNGSIVTVLPESTIIETIGGQTEVQENNDLFWALRGGIGGTFGIVTEYRYRLIPHPENIVRAYVAYTMEEEIAESVIQEYASWLINIADDNVGGEMLSFAENGEGNLVLKLLYFGTWDQGWPILEPLFNFRIEDQVSSTITNLTNYFEWILEQDPDQNEFYTYLFSRFMFEDDMVSEEPVLPLADAILRMHEFDTGMFCVFPTTAGRAKTFSTESASISPQFRTSEAMLICGTSGNQENNIQDVRAFAEIINQFGAGTYPNESDYFLEDWKTEYWGSMERYERLLAIKRQWDPNNRLWCHHCVGSDEVL